nr:MAG TPA: hypothetical protein [Caudoviricetes sp.]
MPFIKLPPFHQFNYKFNILKIEVNCKFYIFFKFFWFKSTIN